MSIPENMREFNLEQAKAGGLCTRQHARDRIAVLPTYEDLCAALQAMVSAQHAGAITGEMYEAWEKAGRLLDLLNGRQQ